MSAVRNIFFLLFILILSVKVNADTTRVNRVLYNSLNGLEVSEPQKLALYIELTEDARAFGIESIIRDSCEKYLTQHGLEIINESHRSEKLCIYFDLKKTILDTLPKTVIVSAEFYRPVYFEIENNLYDFVGITWRESRLGYTTNIVQILERVYEALDIFIKDYFEANKNPLAKCSFRDTSGFYLF